MTVYMIHYDRESQQIIVQRMPGGRCWIAGSTLGL